MMPKLRRLLLPASVFVAVLLLHFAWLGVFPEKNAVQDQWIAAPVAHVSWLSRYVESQSYWLGISYGMSLAFAAIAIRRYREGQFCRARNLAIGSVTFSGVLSVVGCYLLGCCGSPMLAVYVSLLGAAFIPFAKPLVAGVTFLSILLGWWWMNRHSPTKEYPRSSTCDCGPNAVHRRRASQAASNPIVVRD